MMRFVLLNAAVCMGLALENTSLRSRTTPVQTRMCLPAVLLPNATAAAHSHRRRPVLHASSFSRALFMIATLREVRKVLQFKNRRPGVAALSAALGLSASSRSKLVDAALAGSASGSASLAVHSVQKNPRLPNCAPEVTGRRCCNLVFISIDRGHGWRHQLQRHHISRSSTVADLPVISLPASALDALDMAKKLAPAAVPSNDAQPLTATENVSLQALCAAAGFDLLVLHGGGKPAEQVLPPPCALRGDYPPPPTPCLPLPPAFIFATLLLFVPSTTTL